MSNVKKEVLVKKMLLQIVEENNYYPFGLKHKGYNSNVTSTNPALKPKYNGIELEDALGLDLYEMDMRQYDPAIARWTSIDPVIHYEYSTYSAFDNNPIFWADPSGANSESDLDKWVAQITAEWNAIDNGASIRDVWGSGNMDSGNKQGNQDSASASDGGKQNGSGDPPTWGQIDLAISYDFKKTFSFLLSFNIEKKYNLGDIDLTKSGRVKLVLDLILGDQNKINAGLESNTKASYSDGSISFSATTQSSLSYKNGKIDANFINLKAYTEHKSRDNYNNSATSSFGLRYKKGINLYGNLKLSTLPSGYYGTAGQNATFGFSSNFTTFMTTYESELSGSYKSKKIRL